MLSHGCRSEMEPRVYLAGQAIFGAWRYGPSPLINDRRIEPFSIIERLANNVLFVNFTAIL